MKSVAARFFLLCLALPALAQARGVSSSFWACGDVRAPEAGYCAKHGGEVRSYYLRCVKPRLKTLNDGPAALALIYNSYLKIFDREMGLLTRLVPSGNFDDEWNSMAERWKRRLAAHPELGAFDESTHVDSGVRGGLRDRLNSLPALRQRLNLPAREAGLGFLTAALLVEASPRDRDRVYSLYPELVSSSGPTLVSAFLALIGRNLQDIRALLKEDKQLNARQRRLSSFIDDRLREQGANADRLITGANQTLRIEFDGVVARVEATLDKIEKRPSRTLKQDALLTSARANIDPKDSLLNQNLWAAQCTAWQDDRWWEHLERANESFLFPALSYSFFIFAAGYLTDRAAEGYYGALQEVPSLRALKVLGFIRRVYNINNLVGVPLFMSSSLIALNDINRRKARAMREFYLSPVPLPGSAQTDIKELTSSRRWALFNTIYSFLPVFMSVRGMPFLGGQ